MKQTQKERVKNYILENGNEPCKYDTIEYALNIKVPNVRRILGQGVFSNDFERVSRGFYIVNEKKLHDEFKEVMKNASKVIEKVKKNKGLK